MTSNWGDQNTPTPTEQFTPRVLVLVLGPEMEEVYELLKQSRVQVRIREAVDEVADPRGALPDEVLLVPQVALPRLEQFPRGARWEGARPVVAICPDASLKDLEEALDRADDAIPWPEGRKNLLARVVRMSARTRAQRDTSQLRRQVGAIQDLTDHLASRVEQELVYTEALDRIQTWVGGDRVILLNFRSDGALVKMADTDEPGGAGQVLNVSNYPEVVRVTEEAGTVVLLGPQPDGGDDELSQSLGEGSVKAALVVPLFWEGEVSGALEVWFDVEDRVDAVNRTFLSRLAGVISVTLRGAEALIRQEKQTNLTTMRADEETPGPPEVEQYKEYFQRTLDGIVVLDPHGKVMHMNLAGEQITGYSYQGILAMSWEKLVVEADRPMLTSVLDDLREEGQAESFDLRLISTSGDPITVAVSPNAVMLEEGLVVLSFRDVTEARQLEEELRSTKEYLERLIDSTVDGIIVTGSGGKVVLFNRGAERIFGKKADEVRDHALAEVLGDPALLKKLDDMLAGRMEEDGRLETMRILVGHGDEEEVPVSVSASLFAGEGQGPGIVISVRDLSDRARMEERLAQAQEKLVETEKQVLIAELAGTTAHELNQPLTSIMGYSELLKRRMDDEDPNVRSVGIIMSEAERMADIVRKIGKITRYETKSYVGDSQILDLDRASEEEE